MGKAQHETFDVGSSSYRFGPGNKGASPNNVACVSHISPVGRTLGRQFVHCFLLEMNNTRQTSGRDSLGPGCAEDFSTNSFHLRLDHLVIDQAPVANPLPISTYTDEDFVGKVKRLCILTHPQNMSYQILQRYAAYTCVRWLRQLTE